MLLLLACTPDTGDSAVSDVPYEPAPYIVEEEDPPSSSFSAEQVADAISTALLDAPTINAEPVFPAYFAVMEGQSDGCPDYYENEGNVYWYDYCTSSEGTYFEGYTLYYNYDGYVAEDGTVYEGDALFGVSRVTDGRGFTFEAGGSAANLHVTAADGSYQAWQSIVAGSFAYDGPEARGTWVEAGAAPDIEMIAYLLPSTGGRAFMISGGIADLGGDFPVVVFDAVTLFDALIGGSCPEEPGGVVSVRDTNGYWYDVIFDGQTEYGEDIDLAGCDGCGSAWFQGEPVGEVCLDFDFLNTWGDEPW